MIPHHEGAVTMAEDVLQKSKRSEIQKLAQDIISSQQAEIHQAQDIISSQQAEIHQMKQWRTAWYNQ
jgi:uncharacterized protein (DUF305 family)